MTKSARLDFVRPAGTMHKSDGETSTQDETVRDVLLVALTVASGAATPSAISAWERSSRRS